jgi:AAA+ ATPase superfamily predicted ATPase
MSFMEHQVLGYKSPLFGRRTNQIKLLPFTFSETKQFFPKMEAETLAGIFAITGGIPQYLQHMHEDYSLEENIKKAFLSKEAPLFEEPSNLLKQELREPAIYNTILDHLANGKTKISEIAGNGEISTSRVSQRLTNMIELGIVEKVTPIGESKKKAIYRIKDHLFRFWYRFIYMNQDYIEIDQTEELLDYIMKYFSEFMSAVFEEISIQWLYLQMKQKKIDKTIATLGNWWGTNKKQKSQEEIDIVGFDLTKKYMLIGECKWKNQPQDLIVLKKLKERSNLFVALNKWLYVFAKKSFKERAIEYAKENNIHLITYSEMYDDF